jgi:hypothetical protein
MVFMDPNSLMQRAVNQAVIDDLVMRSDTRVPDRRWNYGPTGAVKPLRSMSSEA